MRRRSHAISGTARSTGTLPASYYGRGPSRQQLPGYTVLLKQFFNASRMFTRSNFAGFDAPGEIQLSVNLTRVANNAQGIETCFLVAGVAVTIVRQYVTVLRINRKTPPCVS